MVLGGLPAVDFARAWLAWRADLDVARASADRIETWQPVESELAKVRGYSVHRVCEHTSSVTQPYYDRIFGYGPDGANALLAVQVRAYDPEPVITHIWIQGGEDMRQYVSCPIVVP